jgi:hypothetical protein
VGAEALPLDGSPQRSKETEPTTFETLTTVMAVAPTYRKGIPCLGSLAAPFRNTGWQVLPLIFLPRRVLYL